MIIFFMSCRIVRDSKVEATTTTNNKQHSCEKVNTKYIYSYIQIVHFAIATLTGARVWVWVAASFSSFVQCPRSDSREYGL